MLLSSVFLSTIYAYWRVSRLKIWNNRIYKTPHDLLYSKTVSQILFTYWSIGRNNFEIHLQQLWHMPTLLETQLGKSFSSLKLFKNLLP